MPVSTSTRRVATLNVDGAEIPAEQVLGEP